MNTYLPPNDALEDLISALDTLKPGWITSRMVVEISTDDKNLINLLKTLNVEDDYNNLKVPGGMKPIPKARRRSPKKLLVEERVVKGEMS